MNFKTNSIKIIILLICIVFIGTSILMITRYYINQENLYSDKLVKIIDRDEESELSEKELENYEIEINKELNMLLKENTDHLKIKQCYYAIGAIKYLQNKSSQSIDYLNQALEYGGIELKNKDNIELDVKIYSALSSNYIIKKELNKSNIFFKQAKTKALKNNRKDLLCELYYGKSKSMASSGYNINESISLMRKALEYTDLETHRIRNYIYLSTLYKLTEDFDLALEYTINALEIAIKLNDDISMNKCIISLGEIYYTQKNYSKTIYIYESYFIDHKLLTKENKLKVYGYLSECYAKEGNYAKYKMYRDKYIDLATKENDIKNLVWIYLVCSDIEIDISNIYNAKIYLEKSKNLYENNKDNMYSNTDIMISFIENKINYIENKNYKDALYNYNVLLEKLRERGIKTDINSIISDEVLNISLENNDINTFKKFAQTLSGHRVKQSSQTYTDSIYTGINNTIKEKELFKEKIKSLILFLLAIVSIYELVNSKVKNKKIEKLNLKLREISILDPLTNLYNRTYLNEILKEAIDKKKEITFIMIDIDHFKLYNDNYGHINGDKVLTIVSNIIKNTFKDDIVFRYGGEEFCIIAYKTIKESIVNVEDLRINLNTENIKHEYSNVSDRITLSIGLASRRILTENDVIDITKESDINLYKSKENGRNRYNY